MGSPRWLLSQATLQAEVLVVTAPYPACSVPPPARTDQGVPTGWVLGEELPTPLTPHRCMF